MFLSQSRAVLCFPLMLLLPINATADEDLSKAKWVPSTAFVVPKETATEGEGYFAIIEGYAKRYGLSVPNETLRAEAVEWSVTRGARSGRVAWQFIQDLAGRLGKKIEN